MMWENALLKWLLEDRNDKVKEGGSILDSFLAHLLGVWFCTELLTCVQLHSKEWKDRFDKGMIQALLQCSQKIEVLFCKIDSRRRLTTVLQSCPGFPAFIRFEQHNNVTCLFSV